MSRSHPPSPLLLTRSAHAPPLRLPLTRSVSLTVSRRFMLSAIILALTFLKDDAMLVGERRKMLFAPEPHVCVQDYCGCECASTIVGVSGCSSQVSV